MTGPSAQGIRSIGDSCAASGRGSRKSEAAHNARTMRVTRGPVIQPRRKRGTARRWEPRRRPHNAVYASSLTTGDALVSLLAGVHERLFSRTVRTRDPALLEEAIPPVRTRAPTRF